MKQHGTLNRQLSWTIASMGCAGLGFWYSDAGFEQ